MDDLRAKVISLADNYNQSEISKLAGISRTRVCRILIAEGVKTQDRRGRKRTTPEKGVCPSCKKEFTLDSHQRVHRAKGQQPCCSPECLHKRRVDWAKNYEGYKRGPEANRWKHGMYSNESREASKLIAAINRHVATINKHVKEGASI